MVVHCARVYDVSVWIETVRPLHGVCFYKTVVNDIVAPSSGVEDKFDDSVYDDEMNSLFDTMFATHCRGSGDDGLKVDCKKRKRGVDEYFVKSKKTGSSGMGVRSCLECWRSVHHCERTRSTSMSCSVHGDQSHLIWRY